MILFKKRRRLRDLEERIAFARLHLSEDQRWMHHSRIVARLTARYSLMLSDVWRSTPLATSDQLRRDLDLEPLMQADANLPGYAAHKKLSEFRDLLLEHAVNHEDDAKWDEAAWHERVVAALADYLEQTK